MVAAAVAPPLLPPANSVLANDGAAAVAAVSKAVLTQHKGLLRQTQQQSVNSARQFHRCVHYGGHVRWLANACSCPRLPHNVSMLVYVETQCRMSVRYCGNCARDTNKEMLTCLLQPGHHCRPRVYTGACTAGSHAHAVHHLLHSPPSCGDELADCRRPACPGYCRACAGSAH